MSLCIRHIRFYVPSVRSNRNKPILPIWFQNIHIWQHWCRILRTKCDEVNHIRCQTISCHLPFIIISVSLTLVQIQCCNCTGIQTAFCLFIHTVFKLCQTKYQGYDGKKHHRYAAQRQHFLLKPEFYLHSVSPLT